MAELNSTLVKFVIGTVVLFSLIFLVTKEANVYDDSMDKQICKQAVKSMAITNVEGKNALEIFNKRGNKQVQCPIIEKSIKSSEKDVIKEKLAQYMYDSWDMMGEGRFELFPSEGSETYCILTHHIKFEDDAKNVGKVEGFVDYLMSHKIKGESRKKSYFDYLKCYNTPEMKTKTKDFGGGVNVIETTNDYGVMFIYSKKEHLHKVWAGMEGTKYGTLAGGLASVGTFLVLFPEPTMSTKVVGSALLIGAGAITGGVAGYTTGSEVSADWSACTILFPYTKEYLDKFQCTYMPGVQGSR
ncbi:MAG: hypothetical protein ACQESF_00215 [Nanobdellota archaeon]